MRRPKGETAVKERTPGTRRIPRFCVVTVFYKNVYGVYTPVLHNAALFFTRRLRLFRPCCIPLGRLPRALGSMSSGSGGDIGASSSGSHSLTLTAGLPGPHPTRLPSSWVPPTLETVPLWVVLLSISAACTASRRSARIDTCGASARRAPVWHYDRLGSRALPCSL